MSALKLQEALREQIELTDLHLTQIARRANIRYHNLYRFWTQGRELSIVEAEAVFVALTGKTFITIPDSNNDVL